MSTNNDNAKSGGIGVTGLLLVAFVVLKLCGVINWSWWWVLSPIWIPLLLVALIFVVFFAGLFIRELTK